MPRPWRRRLLLSIATAVLALVLGLGLAAALRLDVDPQAATAPPRTPGPRPPGPEAQVTVTGAVLRTVPRSFLGLSTEYWTLPLWNRSLSLLERVLELLRAEPGDRPVLRIGGDSADRSLWESHGHDIPDWAFGLTPAWVQEVSRLVSQTGARLILDLNLVTATPAIAALWARTAQTELPPHSIVGFEIGNEPDLYRENGWRMELVGDRTDPPVLLPRSISAHGYAHDFLAYARELAHVAPHTPLLAPALANPVKNVRWLATLLARPHPDLGEVTVHRYPYSACALIGSAAYPTVSRVLGDRASTKMAAALRGVVALAHGARLPLRLSELNSVTCGGRPGVSDTFATALWAPDALFDLLRVGVDAVNVHVRARAINAAFVLGKRGLVARPLLYGLVLFTKTLGPGARLLRVAVHARAGSQLKAWAVAVRGHSLHVLLLDKGRRGVTVLLHLRAHGSATVQRLLAASPSARGGVTLGGQWLDGAGDWRGSPSVQRLAPGPRGYRVFLPPDSAALVWVGSPPARVTS